MPKTPSRAKAVTALATFTSPRPQCPKCKALPGQKCFSTGFNTYGIPLDNFHKERSTNFVAPIKSRVQLYIEAANKKA